MTQANTSQRTKRSLLPHSATHLFTVGQAVRLKGGFRRAADIYLITAKLPPSGDAPQYRIRNHDEQFERVTTQDNLQSVATPTGGESATLIEESFGHSGTRSPTYAAASDPSLATGGNRG
jgi:hypothetical protein